jgi:hypothetical protein
VCVKTAKCKGCCVSGCEFARICCWFFHSSGYLETSTVVRVWLRQAADSFRWVHFAKKDNIDAIHAITENMARLPKLKELGIEMVNRDPTFDDDDEPAAIPLRHFKNMSSLELDWHDFPGEWYQADDIIAFIGASPDLRRFRLWSMESSPVVDDIMQEVFLKARPQLVELELSSLTLHSSSLLNFITPKLKALELVDANGSGFSWQDLWSQGKDQNVKLESLRLDVGVEEANESLIEFLLSYKGLVVLCLSKMGPRNRDCNDGQRFWTEVVPNHQSTLRDLEVGAKVEGNWCYGPAAAHAIDECSLDSLEVSVCEMDSRWASSRLYPDGSDRVTTEIGAPAGAPSNCVVSLQHSLRLLRIWRPRGGRD